jgi:hypothetical protein
MERANVRSPLSRGTLRQRSEERDAHRAPLQFQEVRRQRRRLQRQQKGFADFAESDAFRLIAQRGFEALNWFTEWFEADAKRLVIDRYDESGAGVIRHLHSLLGIAVSANPGVVTADRHDREITHFVAERQPAESTGTRPDLVLRTPVRRDENFTGRKVRDSEGAAASTRGARTPAGKQCVAQATLLRRFQRGDFSAGTAT